MKIDIKKFQKEIIFVGDNLKDCKRKYQNFIN